MRIGLVLLPLAACSAPAFAQAAKPQPELGAAMADPAVTEQLVDIMQSMSKVVLDMPVGDVRAAVEGRVATPAERQATVGAATGLSEQQLRAQLEAARPVMVRSMQAMARTLPHMMQGLARLEQSLERAAANMPDPTYPRR